MMPSRIWRIKQSASVDNTVLDLLNSSYATKTKFILDCFIIHSKKFPV